MAFTFPPSFTPSSFLGIDFDNKGETIGPCIIYFTILSLTVYFLIRFNLLFFTAKNGALDGGKLNDMIQISGRQSDTVRELTGTIDGVKKSFDLLIASLQSWPTRQGAFATFRDSNEKMQKLFENQMEKIGDINVGIRGGLMLSKKARSIAAGHKEIMLSDDTKEVKLGNLNHMLESTQLDRGLEELPKYEQEFRDISRYLAEINDTLNRNIQFIRESIPDVTNDIRLLADKIKAVAKLPKLIEAIEFVNETDLAARRVKAVQPLIEIDSKLTWCATALTGIGGIFLNGIGLAHSFWP